jgi:hypothetical protein
MNREGFVYQGQCRPSGNHPNDQHWQQIRAAAIERDKRCRTCGNPEDLDCHHVTYDRFGSELLSDVIMVCNLCHEAITARLRRSRYAFRSVSSFLGGKSHGTGKVQAGGNLPADTTQRAHNRPLGQILDSSETNKRKAEEDRSRLRGAIENRVVRGSLHE